MPDITTKLAGREIEYVMKNDDVLVIRCMDGHEAHIAWKDETGKRLPGEPKVVWFGKRILAKTAHLGARFMSAGG